MADTKVSAFTDLANPAPANSYVPVVVTGDTTNYKTPLVRPGQPTRFLTLTYHHPGNEDGNSVSATTGIPIPDSTIAAGSSWALSFQLECATTARDNIFAASYSLLSLVRPVGGVVGFDGWFTGYGQVANNLKDNFNPPTFFASDSRWDAQLISSSTSLLLQVYGMSTNTPTDWTINVQLTPIASE